MTISLIRTVLLRAYQPSRSTLIQLPLLTRSRLLSTTSSLSYPSIGSGKGGKADKDAAAKLKKEKEKAAKAAKKAKEDAKKIKEKEKQLKLKEKKLKDSAKKEAAKEKKLKDKVKKDAAKTTMKEKRLKAAERKKVASAKKKEKEKAAKAAASKRPPTSRLNPPKGPQSPWQIFLSEYLAKEKAKLAPGEKGPGAPAIAAQAAPLYRELSHSERSEYLAKSQESRDAYPALLAAWQATLTPADIKEENIIRRKRRKLGVSHKRELKIPGEPKQPMNAYTMFSSEAMKDPDQKILGGLHSMIESSKIIAAAWKQMSDEDKKPYLDAATAAREEYKVKKSEFDAEQERKAAA